MRSSSRYALSGVSNASFPADGVADRDLASDDVRPTRAEGVLEIGHEHGRPRVQGVDHHLRLGRPGDLHAPVVEVRRGRRDPPLGRPDLRGGGQEVRPLACRDPRVALCPPSQQGRALGAEPALQVGEEGDRVGRQDVRGARDGRRRRARPHRRVASRARRPPDGRLDLPVWLGRRDEDLALVRAAERRQVDEPVVEVRHGHVTSLIPGSASSIAVPITQIECCTDSLWWSANVASSVRTSVACRASQSAAVVGAAPGHGGPGGHDAVPDLGQRRVAVAREAGERGPRGLHDHQVLDPAVHGDAARIGRDDRGPRRPAGAPERIGRRAGSASRVAPTRARGS